MEGLALRLVSPNQPLPQHHGKDKGGLRSGAPSREGGCILWGTQVGETQGEGTLEFPLAMGDGGRARGRGEPLSVLTVPSQSFSYRHSRRWAASSSFRLVFCREANGF